MEFDKVIEEIRKESLIKEYEEKCELLEIYIKIHKEHGYLEGYINGLEHALVELGIL